MMFAIILSLWFSVTLAATATATTQPCDNSCPSGTNAPGAVAPYFVQTTSGFFHMNAGEQHCLTLMTTRPAGTIVVSVMLDVDDGSSVMKVTDDAGNTYMLRGQTFFYGLAASGSISVYIATKANPATFVAISIGLSCNIDMYVTEYTGIDDVDPASPATASGSFTSNLMPSTITATTTVSCTNALLFAYYEAKNLVTSIDAAFVSGKRSDCNGNFIGDRIVSAPGPYQFVGSAQTASSALLIPLCVAGSAQATSFTVVSGSSLIVSSGGLFLQSVVFEPSTTLVVEAGSALSGNGTITLNSTNIIVRGVNQSGLFVVMTARSLTGAIGTVTAESGCGGLFVWSVEVSEQFL
jgi:hypothetical protein